jgi:hypothetical protein|tara:strand:- start:169 stop:756 length:588 start_codon:yes stop_codon:yes gene_type:complete
MANETTKMGLIPVRKVGGQSWTGGQQKYRIASGATTAIFQGDLVTQLTAGTIGRHAASGTVPILGVFNGCSYTDPTSGETVFSNSYPGSISASDIVANVIDDPMVQFSIQSDEAFPVTDLFGNFDIVDSSPVGDTKTGTSNMQLDTSTGATTATLPLKAIDISQDPENSDVASAGTNVIVVIQNHVMGAKSAGLA